MHDLAHIKRVNGSHAPAQRVPMARYEALMMVVLALLRFEAAAGIIESIGSEEIMAAVDRCAHLVEAGPHDKNLATAELVRRLTPLAYSGANDGR